MFAWDDGALDRRKVIECALSRVCGGCGQSLGRPIAFAGDADEVARNTFRAPPMHPTCAERACRTLDPAWQVVLTSGFEFVRPTADDADRRLRFVPNSLL